ncbi:hypothetical protein SEVIR_8G248500v4 [Setaria viridis]|uniref:Uncharacterized protein n=1 Tax=Setaria viridis TaxID=4556 RepID=A0A4U6TJA5_SETVI|nr:hypothetical protein SEVIR_8G248500v2 [Setaria viridis]
MRVASLAFAEQLLRQLEGRALSLDRGVRLHRRAWSMSSLRAATSERTELLALEDGGLWQRGPDLEHGHHISGAVRNGEHMIIGVDRARCSATHVQGLIIHPACWPNSISRSHIPDVYKHIASVQFSYVGDNKGG